jgi:hypothetical protein
LASSGFAASPTFVFAASPALSAPFDPAQIRAAYGLGNISLGSVTGNGAGQTIAIVDAYNDPDITSDVVSFNSMYTLQQFNVSGGPTFTVENQTGGTSPLPSNATAGDWDVEESLDVEWAHTIAPMANIILFEANSNGNDLYTAAIKAASTPGVSVVSMSWGGSETSDETSFDSDFLTPAGHEGVTFVASTGDNAEPGEYPAYSPNVVAVGGTSLTINSDGSYGGETGWSDSGGGISSYETQPSYQMGNVNNISTSRRTIPDVSWLADPTTGVDVYDSYYTRNSNHIYQVGGTSLAAPMWSALFSIVDQGRALKGETPLDGRSQTLPLLYQISSSDFHDITSGSNGYSAMIGYDLVTGRGSPVPSSIVNDLVNVPTYYVDAAAPGPTFNGSSWADAYTTIQAAQAVAKGGDQILVSQGTYYPGASRSSSFTLVSGVDIYGGYAGYGAASPNAENPLQFTSILSGDIGTVGNNSDNTYHVVTAADVTTATTLDGFTITLGNANGSSTNADGGGLYASILGPTLVDCTFLNNTASNDGGGAYVAGTSTNNEGSGMFFNCVFASNSATLGAGDYGNYAAQMFTNCTFTTNAASSLGRAIYASNVAATLYNCILWADTGSSGAEINTNGTTVTATYSDIQGGFTGTGNINSNPVFILAPGNLELSSDSPAIDAGSNAAVAPFMVTDAADNPRVVDYPQTGSAGAIVDMGAYEAQIPTVVAGALATPAGQQLTFQFSQNVSSSLTAGDLTLTSLAGGPASSPATISFNTTTNVATITLNSALPAGIYQADLGAAGAHLSSDYIFDFAYLPAGSSLALSGEQTFTVSQFYMDPSATLDIGTDALVVSYNGTTPASTISALITSAYNNGDWNGVGITSSDISTGSAVGYFDSGSALTIRLTWDGDANLNGTIDSNDLSLVALGEANNGTRWQDGNFNYDGQVNSDDWQLLFLGTAASNGQPINSAAIVVGSLPASAPAANVPAISAVSVFSNVQALLGSDPNNLLVE